MTDLATLTALAQAANQTEWPKRIAGIEGDTHIAATGPWYRERGNMKDDRAERDAAFIAACDPQTILALVAQIRALTSAIQWCSGSEDFAPGGKARQGYEKIVQPLLIPPSEPRDG